MIVVAIIGLLAVIAVPAFVRVQQSSRSNVCIYNLNQIESAKDQFAFENGKRQGDAVTGSDLTPYMKRGFQGIVEPFGGTYDIGAVGTDPVCSQYDGLVHPATI
jgi:type II secretory pathway pseudopilin PulG